jgi:hypothetical protein
MFRVCPFRLIEPHEPPRMQIDLAREYVVGTIQGSGIKYFNLFSSIEQAHYLSTKRHYQKEKT